MNIAINPERTVQRYQSGNRCSFYAGGISSLFYDFEWANYSVVGKLTQTLCQSSLLWRRSPQLRQVLQSHKPIISESLTHVCRPFVLMRRGHSRCLVLLQEECYACQEKIFKRDLYETSGSRSWAPSAFARNK